MHILNIHAINNVYNV